MREMPFQGVKFQKFFGGACPQTPLECALPCFDVPSKIPGSAPDSSHEARIKSDEILYVCIYGDAKLKPFVVAWS